MRQIRLDLVKTAYALIWTEGGRGPFAVLSEGDLRKFLAQYRERKIKTHVYVREQCE